MEDLNQVDDLANAEFTSDIDAILKPLLGEEPVEAKEEVLTPIAPKPKSNTKKNEDTLVLYSGKNMAGISKGYSKVSKSLAAELLKNKNIRLATEEEIKENFNK